MFGSNGVRQTNESSVITDKHLVTRCFMKPFLERQGRPSNLSKIACKLIRN